MKKKQRNTTFLLVAVLAIWGILIYKVFAALDSDDDEVVVETVAAEFDTPRDLVERNTFELFIPERDPFLGVVINPPKTEIIKKARPKPTNQPNIDLEAIWQNISYKGMLAHKKENKNLYLVSIKSEEVLLKLKQSFGDFKLVKADSEAITLQYINYKKSFNKE